MAPVSAHDVAAYIVSKQNPISGIKLQKLLYYSQAWSLVWDDAPLFLEPIQAWAYGPVVPEIYQRHKGQVSVASWQWGDASKLSSDQMETVDIVLAFYGDKSAQWLSDLTHMEDPWIRARRGLEAGERGEQEITQVSMQEYYASIPLED